MKQCLDLAGKWECSLDPDDVGQSYRWFESKLDSIVELPGSLDENGLGEVNTASGDLSGLSRKVRYTGVAWFSKEIELPKDWTGEPLCLVLERCHWFCDVWFDGIYLGRQDSLSIPHRFAIPAVSHAGHHRITLRIDNTPHIPIGRIGHALTDWTQTNWNGVIGAMQITREEIAIQDLVIVSGIDAVQISGLAIETGEVSMKLRSQGRLVIHTVPCQVGEAFSTSVKVEDFAPWHPDSPNLVDVTVRLNGGEVTRQVGLRTIRCDEKSILLNDQPVFLRGTLECCVFPKTGYPPTRVEEWQKVLGKAKEFGLNHIRFHSWCPPEAAFVAADELGLILQVELPVWTGLWAISSDEILMDFCRREAHRILREYGHHASFLLFALGNEISFYGSEPAVDALIEELKSDYPNRIYTFSAQGTHLSPVCDFYVQADNGKPGPENRPLRGSTWFGVGSRFDRDQPNTSVNCNEAADQFDRPVISHEVAEWAVFPDVHHASRYDGVLEARNFTEIARMLAKRGMLDQVSDFVEASGKLSAQLYKEEIETLLRTRGLSGYQLLGLTDFPGQGTATIGMLDAFWEEKGFIDATTFRQFCASTVPLLSVDKFVWLEDEVFTGNVHVFHCGAPETCALSWRVLDRDGSVLASGDLGAQMLSAEGINSFGTLQIPLAGLPTCTQYHIELVGEPYGRNQWPFWLLPQATEPSALASILVAPFYRQDVVEAFAHGKNVWLRINPNRIWSGIPGRFAPAFWSPIHFKEQVGTMGTLIDADHPIFGDFPTEGHSDWQWWDILTRSKALNLNELAGDFRPLLQVIDRYERNDKLGTIFEARVGTGKLLVTAIDFEDLALRPAARQLEQSIKSYLLSERFEPKQQISPAELARMFAREP